jgi:hypothetical protein
MPKYNFTCIDGHFINPLTLKPFKRNDEFQGLYYMGLEKRHEKTYPKFKSLDSLVSAKERSKQYRNRSLKNPDLHSHIAEELLQSAKARAKKRFAKVTITKKWILDRLRLGRCEFTGLCFELDMPYSAKSPSLDRKNNFIRDYTPENTMLVLNQVNMCRNQWSDLNSLEIWKGLVKRTRRRNSI